MNGAARTVAPILVPATHVSPCYPYREKRAGETDEQYGLRLAVELEAAIVAQGADRVIAFVAETVGGATAGVLTPVPGYFKAVRAVCDKYGVLLILDEVMCGMGRTGSLHACEQEGIVPDLITIAKGLGGGYQPIGAVLAQGRVVDAMSKGSGFFQHGHTYLGHPMACAAALAVQQVIRRDGLVTKVREDGAAFGEMLAEALGGHAHVGDIRGRGFFWGIELVADRANKAPFDPAFKINAAIKKDAMARGLLCYPFGGTVDGRQGDHVLLAPPFIATRQDLQEIVVRLAASIDAVTRLCHALTASFPIFFRCFLQPPFRGALPCPSFVCRFPSVLPPSRWPLPSCCRIPPHRPRTPRRHARQDQGERAPSLRLPRVVVRLLVHRRQPAPGGLQHRDLQPHRRGGEERAENA
jgi:adenosylmethionine-8-amino-7-oxononanoate aminotransferase